MEKDKKYNVILGLMIFFFIIIVGVGIAWGLGYIGLNKNSISEDKAGYESNNSTIENNQVKVEEQASNKVNNQTTVNKTENNVSVLNIDGSKCLNKVNDGVQYKYHCSFNGELGVYISDENNKLYLRLLDGDLTDFMDSITIKTNTNYEIKNINVAEVADVFVGAYGNGINYPVIFFLMKNGTVNWLDVQAACENKDFNAEGIISDVNDIVKIAKCVYSAGTNGETEGGAYTVLGFKQDGSFYDLISKTVNK